LPLQAQGEFALVKEELESALELSGQPVKRGTMAHKHIVYMMLADAAGQLHDVASLAHYTSLLEELATQDDHQPYLAIAHRSWGIMCRLNGEYGEAKIRLQQALEMFEELDFRWQTGRTLVEMAELAQTQSDEASAREYFSRALAAYESIKAMPDAERTSAILAALG
jgi:tetratricopeptide (TPR) repeat protein